jgi:hypothetical protein
MLLWRAPARHLHIFGWQKELSCVILVHHALCERHQFPDTRYSEKCEAIQRAYEVYVFGFRFARVSK